MSDVTILWEKFNTEADVERLLQSHGWTKTKTRGDRVDYTRPGKSAREGVSANWHTQKRLFYVFTTGSDFDANRAYNAAQVFCVLECNGDMRETARKLIDLGYCMRTTLRPRKMRVVGRDPLPV